jgi:mannose-6-phosphate isomerase-like protein (cupin superfamily)
MTAALRLIRRCLVLGIFAARLFAQDTLYFPPPDRIAVRDMKSVPAIDIAPGIHVHTVVGATSSFSFAEFDSGGVAVVHHHTREQADVALSGAFSVTIGDRVEALRPGSGVIIPPNVRHSIANLDRGTKTIIEFHTVRRPDMVPPRPALSFPSSPEPIPLPTGRPIVSRMDVGDGATIIGETCSIQWRRIPARVDLHPALTQTELLLYVVRGVGELVASGKTARVGPGMLIIVPAALQHVELRPAGEVALVEFNRR